MKSTKLVGNHIDILLLIQKEKKLNQPIIQTQSKFSLPKKSHNTNEITNALLLHSINQKIHFLAGSNSHLLEIHQTAKLQLFGPQHLKSAGDWMWSALVEVLSYRVITGS